MSVSKQVFRSGPYADLIAQGVKVGNTLYLSGQVGMDEAGNIPASMAEQTVLAYANIRAVLAEFGAGFDNIVDETFLVTSVEETHDQLEAIFGARAEAYGGIPEVTQTLIGVAALLLPELKLEIKCIAHL
jgi:enamine deaminase RidA (YjgF/YER057c/UK114 family)